METIQCLSACRHDDQGHKDLPVEVQEHYIKTGYRPVDLGFKNSFKSLWKSHNETLNIWTHILGLLYFLYIFRDPEFRNMIAQIPLHQSLPMYVYLSGVCLLFTASSGAHLFNSVSMKWRNICFMLDYSAISIYGSFTAIVYYYYNWHHKIPILIKQQSDIFIPLVLFTSVLATWASCMTRVYHNKLCHLIRTSSFALPFIIGSIPPMMRVCNHMYSRTLLYFNFHTDSPFITDDSSRKVNEAYPKNILIKSHVGLSESEFCYYYCKHLFYLSAAAIVNVIKVPECIYPGNFDIIGHSHQLFHILIFMGVKEQFWLIINDIWQYGNIHEENASGAFNAPISVGHLTSLYILLISSLAGILLWYSYSVDYMLRKKHKS